MCGYTGKKDVTKRITEYRLSRITNKEDLIKAYKSIAKEFNLNTSFEEFVRFHKEVFNRVDYYKDVVKFEHSLKDKCLIGIFSNLNMLDEARLNKEVNLSLYDYVFLSFKFGLRKPEIEFYEKINEIVPVKRSDILLIDDKLENIKAAKKAGWNAFQATGLNLDKIKQKCYEFLK